MLNGIAIAYSIAINIKDRGFLVKTLL